MSVLELKLVFYFIVGASIFGILILGFVFGTIDLLRAIVYKDPWIIAYCNKITDYLKSIFNIYYDIIQWTYNNCIIYNHKIELLAQNIIKR